ncbi:MAG: beta-lactamase class [Acidobacteriaceae bacterium]|nr:beta-lactamase class [Acidobacteriaceae bacterium]
MPFANRFLVTSMLVLAFTSRPAAAGQAKSTVTIDQRVQAAIQGFPGTVSLYAKNLDTGTSYELRADAPVPTASTIKLPIMVELFAEAEEGKLDWNQKLQLNDRDKVSGTGVLTELSGGDLLPIRDLMHLMIVVSDNTATNLILDRIGGDAVNQRMARLGLKQTVVMRKIIQTKPEGFTDEGRKPGNDRWGTGRSCPRDMVILLEKLYRGQLVSKPASEEMITVLKRQRDLQGVGRNMKDTVTASKSGALDHLRSEVAIVYSQHGPVAMAITVNDIPVVDYGVDNPGNLLISDLSQILVEELAPAK